MDQVTKHAVVATERNISDLTNCLHKAFLAVQSESFHFVFQKIVHDFAAQETGETAFWRWPDGRCSRRACFDGRVIGNLGA